MKKCKSAKVRIECKSPEGKASDFIQHFEEIAYPGIKVVFISRVSARTQNKKGNHKTYKIECFKEFKKYNAEIIQTFQETASGWKYDRKILRIAAELAVKENAVLVAYCTNRFIRSRRFKDDSDPNALPTVQEYKELDSAVGWAPMATILHPDLPLSEVSSNQIKSGQKAKGRKGGRPRKKQPGYKKQKRIANSSKVFWMHFVGFKQVKISKLCGIPLMTVNRWIQGCKSRITIFYIPQDANKPQPVKR